MRNQSVILTLILGLGVGTVLAVPAAPATDQAKIAQLVAKLGSDNFRQRDAAKKELDAIGEPALEALRTAAKSTDMEVANNAKALIARIEARAENARMLAPTFIELSFKDETVEIAVAELAKKSGYPIIIKGDKTKLADRRVTLNTGKVSFWKALDMLCEKAELKELGIAKPTADLPLQPIQRQPVQPVPLRRPPQPDGNDATISLVDGKKDNCPIHIEGAFRIRAANDANLIKLANQLTLGAMPEGEIGLLLDMKAEPKIQVQQLLGAKIDKAIDNHDQPLVSSMLTINSTIPFNDVDQLRVLRQNQVGRETTSTTIAYDHLVTQIPVRLKKGDKEATSIKELRGTISIRMRTPVEPIAVVENILKAKGETALGKGGAVMKIIDVKKEENGDIKVEVDLQCPHEIQPQPRNHPGIGGPLLQPIQPVGGLRIQIAPAAPQPVPAAPPINGPAAGPAMVFNPFGLELLDAKGGAVALVQIQNTKNMYRPYVRLVTTTMVFRPTKDQDASKFVFNATRIATVDVPFVLKDVVVK